MFEEKLEIVLITYNRSMDLENTLKQLINSPFSKCKISVLDNNSTDNTTEICDKYEKLFHKLDIIKHSRNIGGNANILRAVETSNSKYTWIMGDDDNYDFSEISDIIDAIESDEFDIISIGYPGYSNWKRGIKTTSNKLINDKVTYFHTMTFISGFIFKTDTYDSNCITKGYHNISNLFPHFVYIVKSVEENFSIYVSKNSMINRGDEKPAAFSGLEWLNGWINSCIMIKDRRIRRNTFYQVATGSSSFTLMVLFVIALDKIRENSNFNRNKIELVSAIIKSFGISRELLFLLLFIPSFYVPAFIYKKVIKTYLTRNYSEERYEIMKKIERNRL